LPAVLQVMGEPSWLAARIGRYGSRNSFIVGINHWAGAHLPRNSGEMAMKNTVKFVAVCVATPVAALGVGSAAPASAAPEMSGHYIDTKANPETGGSTTSDWYVTPCGDGCADVTVNQTQLKGLILSGRCCWMVNGQWISPTATGIVKTVRLFPTRSTPITSGVGTPSRALGQPL
jgi:hypothetical protein